MSLRWLLPVLAWLGLQQSALADAGMPPLSLRLGVFAEHMGQRDTVNPGNVAGLPDQAVSSAARIGAEFGGASGALKLSSSLSKGPGGSASDQDATIVQMFVPLVSTDVLSAYLAVQNIHLDGGYSFHALDFMEDGRIRGNLGDLRIEEEGFALAGLRIPIGSARLTLAYSDDTRSDSDDINRGLRQVLAYLSYATPETDGALVLQKYVGGKWGLGGSANLFVNQGTEVHLAAFLREGTHVPIHATLTGRNQPFYGPDENPNRMLRMNDGRLYPRMLIGTQFTTESQLNFILEYYYDAQGMDRTQWDALMSLVRLHRSRLPGSAAAFNLAYDAEALRTGRQQQASVRVRIGANAWEPEVGIVSSLDRSASIQGRLTYGFGEHWKAWAELRTFFGEPETLFDTVPVRYDVACGLLWQL